MSRRVSASSVATVVKPKLRVVPQSRLIWCPTILCSLHVVPSEWTVNFLAPSIFSAAWILLRTCPSSAMFKARFYYEILHFYTPNGDAATNKLFIRFSSYLVCMQSIPWRTTECKVKKCAVHIYVENLKQLCNTKSQVKKWLGERCQDIVKSIYHKSLKFGTDINIWCIFGMFHCHYHWFT